MKITSREVKLMIADLLFFEDGVDEKGVKQRRSTFPKNHFRGIHELRKKLLDNLEMGLVPKDEADPLKLPIDQIKWVKYNDYINGERDASLKPMAEKYTEDEIEFSEKAISALKFLYKDRSELLPVSEETFEELEKLVV